MHEIERGFVRNELELEKIIAFVFCVFFYRHLQLVGWLVRIFCD